MYLSLLLIHYILCRCTSVQNHPNQSKWWFLIKLSHLCHPVKLYLNTVYCKKYLHIIHIICLFKFVWILYIFSALHKRLCKIGSHYWFHQWPLNFLISWYVNNKIEKLLPANQVQSQMPGRGVCRSPCIADLSCNRWMGWIRLFCWEQLFCNPSMTKVCTLFGLAQWLSSTHIITKSLLCNVTFSLHWYTLERYINFLMMFFLNVIYHTKRAESNFICKWSHWIWMVWNITHYDTIQNQPLEGRIINFWHSKLSLELR